MGDRRVLRRFLSVAAVGLFAALPMPAAKAADPGFCREYAATALRQFHAAFDAPRCRMGMNGARWSSEFRVHYDWCLGAPYRAAREEQEARGRYIYACR